MIGALVSGTTEVWTLSAVVAAVLGGLAVGWAVEYVSPTRNARALVIIVLGMGTLATAVFWSGQVMDAVLSGDPHWGRACGRACLQELFVVCVALAAGYARKRDPVV